MKGITMSKKNQYFAILIAVIAIATIGYVFDIKEIISFINLVLSSAKGDILATTAAICAFLFLGHKNYWFIILACAVITAMIVQYVIIGGGVGVVIISAKTIAFIAIVFLMNFVKLFVK